MKRYDLSRHEFLSLGVLGALGLLEACTLDDSAVGSGSGGQGGSTTSTGGSGGGTSRTTAGSSSGGAAGATTATGSGGSGGAGATAGSGGSGAGAAGKGGSGGTTGVDGGGGTAGSGGSKDAGVDAPKFDAGACTMVVIAAISMNHNAPDSGPHYLRVPAADIVAGAEMTYLTESTPGNPVAQSHGHSIKLTAADFAALRAGMTIKKKSCDGHEHQYGLHCGTLAAVPTGTACMASDFCGSETNPC